MNTTSLALDSGQSNVLTPAQGLAQEMSLLSAVASGERQEGFLAWRCQQALIVPRRLAHKAEFHLAANRMKVEGWPVHIRSTGGDLTPQAPGLINIAIAYRCKREPGAIEASYRALCDPLIEYLKQQGIQASCGAVAGAFCDGDYNITVAGKKLAGTAQRWRRITGLQQGDFAVLAHAVVLCDEPMQRLWNAGNRFYQYCGMEPYIRPECHISMAELLPGEHAAERRFAEIENAYSTCFSRFD
ncbi:lipoate--protein ligase family protein [Marinobacterium stanieri]|uniref:lipoate--protein ligase family protein n=1 Tax=Marinobacterium stanieri TaxID=49186 RepID=UPI0002558410|nr:hypothetical protein [Marinobacterium stanieri]